ncbi:hypothetical protein F0562_004595 [Nyssa sinensis]|uniref:Uncharacterized protein n=1 Tax=Nyssa sinensis TaxID=561372 RepID=A0A5J5BZT6_9ASTE|nr:hypothetical protein F0562_004595 [Nyssa sinensis]
MKLEGSIHREGEELAPTEASTREYRDDEGFTVLVGEDNVEVIEHNKSETSKREGHPQESLLKSEPGKENLESPLDVAAEEIETTASNEHAETITHVVEQRMIDSLEETRKCKTIHADDINNKEIQEEKTISTVDLDKKTVSAEVEIPNKNANDLNVTHPLVEETVQVTDAGDNIKEEIQQEEEASDTELQRIIAKSDANKKSVIEEEVAVKDSDTVRTGEEADQLNYQEGENKKNNSEEATSELNGGDQSCRTDNEMENIHDRTINEEVYEGPKIAEMEEGTEKQIKHEEHTITDHSTESTGEEKTKHSQEDEAEAEKSKAKLEKGHETTSADEGVGIEKQVILEENRIQDQPMVFIEEETSAESSKEDETMVLDTTNRGEDFLEHIVKEADAANDHPTESFEEKMVPESSQEDEANEGYETAGGSTNTERQNMEESAIVDNPTLTVGEEKVQEEVKELNIECIEQNLEATHLTKETKPEATKDEAEPNKDCYTQSTMGTSEEETMSNESNQDLIENSSVPEPEVSEKEIKEEILEKTESTEETSLKEAEPEYKMKVDSSDLASDHPTLIVGEQKVEEEVKELNIERIEHNLEATHHTKETKLEAAKNEADPNKDCNAQSTIGTSEEETMPNENNRDLIENSSVPEPEVSEKEIKEEILEKADSIEETSLKEGKAEYKMEMDSSNQASDHPTLTVEGEVKVLNIECIEKNLEATYPTEETKLETAKDEEEPNKDSYAQSARGTLEEKIMTNKSNRDLIENSSVPEPEEAEAEYKMVDSSDLTSDHPTITVGKEKVEGEVEELNIQCIEQNLEAMHPTDETKLEAAKDEAEPNKDCYAQSATGTSEEETMPNESNRDLTENSSVLDPMVSEKEIKEEILEKADPTEETSLKKAEAECKMQVASSDLTSDHPALTVEGEVKELNIQCTEQNLEATKDEANPNKDNYAQSATGISEEESNRDLIENSKVPELKVSEKEIKEEIFENVDSTEETSLKEAEAEYKMQVDSSDLTSDHPTLTVGEEKVEGEVKELNIECIEQNLEAMHPKQETKPEAVKDEAEPTKDCYAQSATGTSEEETMPNESNRDLIENSSVPELEVSEKEIKEEILEKVYSAEETSLKEAEVEYKKQVDSSDLTLDHPTLTVEGEVKELNIECIEQNPEEIKPEAAKDEAEPNKDCYAQSATGTSEDETMPNESNKDLIPELKVSEKEIKEEILEKVDSTEETSLKEAEVEYKMQVESSDLTSVHPTLTVEGEVKELNIECIEQNLEAMHPAEETRPEAAKDEAEPNKDCYAQSATGTSEEETMPNESNRDLVENSSVPELEVSEKEIKEEDLEKVYSTEETGLKEAEVEYKKQVDSSDLTLDHPTLTVEGEVKELNIECIEQNPEEIKPEAAKDEAEPNKDCYAQSATGTSEDETMPNESNKDLIPELEVSEKEIKEEILEKVDSTEETSLKEAEVEYKMRVDSSDLTSVHPTLTVEGEVKELNIECIEQNLEATHPTEETRPEAAKDEAEPNKDCYAQSATGTSEEETMPNESNRDLIENSSVPELEVSEKEIKEEVLEKVYSTEETGLKEAEVEYKKQVDSSDLTLDHPTLTVEGEVKELNIECIEQNPEEIKPEAAKDEAEPNKDCYAQSATGTSEDETMPNESNKDLIPELEVSEKEIKEEILEKVDSTEETSLKEAEVEYKMQVDSSDLTSVHPTLTVEGEVKELNIECIEQNLEATHPTEETRPEATKDEAEPNKDCYAQSATGTSEEETMPNESKRDLIENSSVPEPEVGEEKVEGEVKELNIECIEQNLEATHPTEETKLEASKDEEEPNKDCYAQSTTRTSEEETMSNESNRDLIENSSVPEPEVDSSDLASEKKGLVTTETSESGSNGADITAKPTKTSELGENKDMENPTARNHETEEAGEKIEHQAQIETHYTMSESEDQREVATSETPLDDIFEQSLEASSALSLKEHNLMTTKTSETTDETPKKDESLYVQAETPLVVEVSEEKLMQKEETSTNPRDGADMRSVDIVKESVNEEVRDEDQELYTPPQADNEKSIFESDVELGSEIGKLETLKDEKSLDIGLEMDKSEDVKPVDEAPKCAEGCDTCADTEKDILEQEHSVKNFEGSLKEGVEIEKAVNESEAGGHSHGSEASETRSISTATKENLESVEPGEGLKCAPDSLPEDQSNKTLPQNKKTRVEEESDNVKNQNTESTEEKIIGQDFQEGKKKMNEEMEPKLEAEDQINKTQHANETIKDVILTEEVLEGVERAHKTENIKEQIIEEESCTRELHTISIADEKVNEVKDPDLEPNENLEATDSNVDTETLKSNVAEDLNWEAEASSMTKALEEEMKKACQKPVHVTSSVSEVSEENIEVAANCKEKIDSTPTVVTEETSLGEVQQDKSVKAFDISSDTKSPETTKTTDSIPQGEEVASVKLEEAFGMVSQLPEIEENADEEDCKFKKARCRCK